MATVKVQSLHHYPGASAAFPSAPTAGNLLIVTMSGGGGAAVTVPTISDGVNTWVHAWGGVSHKAIETASCTEEHIWYAWNCVGGASTPAVTTTLSDVGINLYEYSGIQNTSDPLDAISSLLVTAQATNGTAVSQSVTTSATDLLFSAWANELAGAGLFSAVSSPFTAVQTDNAHLDGQVHALDQVAGTYTATYTNSAPGNERNWVACVVSFKSAPSAAAPTRSPGGGVSYGPGGSY